MTMESMGLASDEYSFPYVVRWSMGDTKVVIAAADTAKKCAMGILDRLEAQIEETAEHILGAELPASYAHQDRIEAAQILSIGGGGSDEEIEWLGTQIASQRIKQMDRLAVSTEARLAVSQGRAPESVR